MRDTATAKTFDAVQMVRTIRDEISVQIAGMSAEEENRWLRATKFSDPTLQRLMDRSAEARPPGSGRPKRVTRGRPHGT